MGTFDFVFASRFPELSPFEFSKALLISDDNSLIATPSSEIMLTARPSLSFIIESRMCSVPTSAWPEEDASATAYSTICFDLGVKSAGVREVGVPTPTLILSISSTFCFVMPFEERTLDATPSTDKRPIRRCSLPTYAWPKFSADIIASFRAPFAFSVKPENLYITVTSGQKSVF